MGDLCKTTAPVGSPYGLQGSTHQTHHPPEKGNIITTTAHWITNSTTVGTATTHTGVTARGESFEVGLSRTDDAEGPGDPIVTVSADMLELFEVEAFTHALHAAVAIARDQ